MEGHPIIVNMDKLGHKPEGTKILISIVVETRGNIASIVVPEEEAKENWGECIERPSIIFKPDDLQAFSDRKSAITREDYSGMNVMLIFGDTADELERYLQKFIGPETTVKRIGLSPTDQHKPSDN